jgi:putative acyl-CoA dehydrogenase
MPGTKGKKGAPGIPPFAPRNLFDGDPILIGALESILTPEIEQGLVDHGAYWGAAEVRELARLAEAHPPRLIDRDGWGERVDLIDYHPARHALVRRSAETGLAISLHEDESPDGTRRHVLRTARMMMAAETDTAHLGVVSTTSAVLAALAAAGEVGAEWLIRAT